ncbi:hypothetical protein HaLaN_04831 [Haematococcus lacustris]|uniref:Uncharacterized protein n=1 Tax=Haematococcus lacustris TaxID=44745 RepID=A0A699YHH4_HAELA|nr:hypothetical protein HaLaN_04831 [Haematococcus lacustris]
MRAPSPPSPQQQLGMGCVATPTPTCPPMLVNLQPCCSPAAVTAGHRHAPHNHCQQASPPTAITVKPECVSTQTDGMCAACSQQLLKLQALCIRVAVHKGAVQADPVS